MPQRSITRRNALVVAAAAAAGTLAATARVARADEVQQLTSAEVLDFLYIDNAEMYAGETQNIAVCLKGYSGFESAMLTVSNVSVSDTVSAPVSNVNGSSMLFSLIAGYEGAYEVTSLDFVIGGVSYSVDFSDCDASYRSFQTSYGVSTMSFESDAGSEDGGPTLQVYTDDGADGITESSSIEEGAAEAISLTAAPMSRSASPRDADSRIVVALDPGHVAVSAGAVGVNGLHEEDCTWKIAQYCKAELDSYFGVKTVYTVTPESNVTGEELQARVDSAVSQGADILVSLHLNSTGTGGARGAEIYVPYNADYNNSTHAVGEALAQKIIGQLEGLGLYNRGVKVRTIGSHDANYDYPDGTIGDYYGIIRRAREKNMPAIIVEHAFIDNWSDYTNFLNSDAKLKSLGVADATGIANYLGISKDSSSMRKMYRMYNPNSGEHFYTADSYERDHLVSVGWRYEGIGWCSDDAESVPVYRQYNPNARAGAHNFTTDSSEQSALVSAGWEAEGIAWYGVSDMDGSTVVDDPYHGLSTRTPIMGASSVSVSQLAAYYKSTGATYPSEVYSEFGAPTIEEFCQILVEEASAEGVKAEVLFAQVSIETGNLRFGGQVQPSQCNFGGLGATDGGASGADFSSYGADAVRMGLRAQAQHLKAYASTDPLNNECVDPRFSLVKRGKAPLVENLGGGNWASDKSYASKLLRVMDAL